MDRFDCLQPHEKMLKTYWFLTLKPFIYALNVWQDDIKNKEAIQAEFQAKLNAPVVIVCAKIESEMMWMSKEEKLEFQSELLEISDTSKIPTLDDLIWLAFDTVGLMYYFTTGEKETKAWTIKKWSTAPQAAGAIHTDFERWFIKAEVINYDEFVELWSWPKAKEKWKVRLEWKEYIVQDWDIMIFKFNV